MSYISQSLTFEVDKIHYTEGDDTWEVMMDWEDSLMSASAAYICCLLYTSPSPRDRQKSRMPSSA